ncbi:polyprenyl synthetase family protein [Geodermatophilus sabuli]|uniref:Geranylgeranyl diphosphate synthase, type II n=1 Tax=Geodermatophilus sabuli TaxID=1564158 RepID=A0A285EC69_9ACTN|nr:polyprenyl synthetase family protein [Geodermatophilus sabuli]MBB3084091.1 geranylgeranyl diphosphate synthase type II [Geodermatophilus sabuli]SNX96635.1 geranylgeranyl diphosphate synthase, type II [Geodermatophilus sabuli]
MTARLGTAAGVERQLAEYRDLTYRALRRQLPTREPRRYLYDLITGQLSHVGKGLRPALCIATCRAFGGSIERALPSAVSIELLHNAFLVHDDIEDGSLYRRNEATLYVEQGIPIAINVGDAMNVLSIGSLIENIPILGADLSYRVFHEAQHLILQSVEGQALELGWTRDNVFELTEDDYLRMVLKKTCWYTSIHPCRIGALIGTSGTIDADRFNLFGFLLGAAFQIQDDILNLVGDEDQYGKEILGDIWEGKRTLILIHALRQCTDGERDELRRVFSVPREQRTERDVQWVFRLFERHASIEFARAALREMVQAALEEFDVAYRDAPAGADRDFIRQLIPLLGDRQV